MRLLRYFGSRYLWESLLVILCLTVAALVEGIGLSSFLPLLSLAIGGPGADAPRSSPQQISQVEAMLRSALASLGLEPSIGLLLIIIVVTAILKAALIILSRVQVGYTVAHVATDLRLGLLRALLAARWSYYTRQPIGVAANAMATEADRASQAYYFLAQFVALGIEGVLYLGFAIALSWRATLVASCAGVVALWTMSSLVRTARRAGRRQTDLLKSLLRQLMDSLHIVKLVKATGQEHLIGPLLQHDTGRLNRQLRRGVLSKETLRALQEPILFTFIACGVYVGVTQLHMGVPAVILLVVLIGRALTSANKMQQRYQSMVSETSALWSLQAMIDRAHEAKEVGSGTLTPTLTQGIELRHVRLSYDSAVVLNNLSIDIPAGQITALVGPSGAGKTSLIDLITQLVSPEAGEVRVDGTPVAQLSTARWREMIGYVPQEMLLIHDTIRVNVTLGDETISRAQVESALRAAGAWPFVSSLPEGMEASVGERGALLSGGQRQRIAIARALVRNPKLLILDEATAALDPETEAQVWQAIERLRGQVTVIAISHQVALMGVADRLYRIEHGQAHLAPVPPRPFTGEITTPA